MEKGSHTKLKDLRGSSFRLHVLRSFLVGRKFQIENVVHLFKSATIGCRLLNACRHTLVSFMLFAWCPLLVLRWPLAQKPSMSRRVNCLWNRIAVRPFAHLWQKWVRNYSFPCRRPRPLSNSNLRKLQRLHAFTSTNVHFMWRLVTLWVHDSQDTSFNSFFIAQLNSEVGRDIGHEKVIMQHRAAVMEGLGRDQGNWKPWTFHAPLVMGKCIIEVQQTFILKQILQFIIRLRCVSLKNIAKGTTDPRVEFCLPK